MTKIVNRKARWDYELGERLEAGVVLTGAEVKSVKRGGVEMGRAYVRVRGGEAWVLGMQIYPYERADNREYEPGRTRKLLLKKKELAAVEAKMKQSRRLLVPTAMYTKRGLIKVELALARGKRKYEKREAIKKRDEEVAVGRELG